MHEKLHNPLEPVALREDSLMFYHVHAYLVMLSKSNDLNKSVLDMNAHYVELQLFLSEVKYNVQLVFDRDHQVFVSEQRLYGNSKKRNHLLKKDMQTIVESFQCTRK